MPRLIVGLPALSQGPMLETAKRLGAPIMISATALAKWQDDGPVPKGHEFNALERRIRQATGDTRPPSAAQARRRVRLWKAWNTAALDRMRGSGMEIHLDSAGFVAMSIFMGWPWTVESYVFGLAAHDQVHRFSSMDLCVEKEVAADRHELLERISKTIRLNRQIRRLSDEAGITHKFMPVIQGAEADDYLRCYEGIADVVPAGATIGIGSMCRRPTRGPEGSMAVIDRLDRELPKEIRFHLFGIKSDGAEASCAFGDRIDSVDSQSFGVRARRIANDRRAQDPTFSKTAVFVSGVMEEWYRGQSARLASPRSFPLQPGMAIDAPWRPAKVIDALETIARAQFNDLIETGALDHDQVVGGRMLEESVFELAAELPAGVSMTDAWTGAGQLPEGIADEPWFPRELAA